VKRYIPASARGRPSIRRVVRSAGLGACATLLLAADGGAQRLAPEQQLARDIFRELIEINTTDGSGDNTRAAEAMAARLVAAGFSREDVRVLAPAERKGNLVARLRGNGSGRAPLLLLAHLDVVEAKRDDWSVDPFTFLERDGYYWGRGTTDDKAMAAIWITNLIRFRQQGIVPDRDIIVALTADEEGGAHNGVSWLLARHRSAIDAAYALNEGGGGQIRNGRRLLNAVQASEKVYQSFRFEVTNRGGHSSRPERDNAIYNLAAALARIAAFEFPVKLNEVTRTYFQRMSAIESGSIAADMRALAQSSPDMAAAARLAEQPYYNALIRTTCVATQLEGGHAENALPQLARATVNCRILPGEDPADVLRTLTRVVADERVRITPIADAKPSPPSPLVPDVMQPIERITSEMWPGVPVVPVMSTGATDGLYLRQAGIPVYGVSGLFGDIDDNRAHGRDERIAIESFHQGLDFLYRLVRALSVPSS
jgi:acetylornithine deacetylase/succinyl-diaminopimelate desuccinylase-like protein